MMLMAGSSFVSKVVISEGRLCGEICTTRISISVLRRSL